MEILQFLLSFFFKEYSDGKYEGVYNLLKDNGFDVIKTLKSLNPQTLSPILHDFAQNKKPTDYQTEYVGLSAIENFADEKIVQSLSEYFY